MTTRVGYLVSQYPATSHTFIAREIQAIRKQGIDISTFSIRMPALNERVTKQEKEEYQKTWYVLPPRKGIIAAHLMAIVRNPISYGRTFFEAMRHRVYGIKAIVMAIVYFSEAIYLADELKRQKVTHLHNHFANPSATVGYLASRFLKIPWSLTLHGASDLDYPSSLLLPDKIEHAKFVACVSYFTRSQVMRRVETRLWRKLFINRCGIELDKFCRKGERLAQSKIRVLCVARLSPEKGLVGLVQAFSKVIDAGIPAELRIIGEGDDRSRIENEITSLKLNHCCQLPGRASEAEVIDELTLADVFVLSSFMEGLPVAIMEAFALEIPVIAPNVGGIAELVEDGVSGLLFSPGNWSQLTDQLIKICTNKEINEQFKKEGKLRIESEFDISQTVTPLAQKFKLLLDNNELENTTL
jgi:glycosyltransferase involved in cell wall biosynthesis